MFRIEHGISLNWLEQVVLIIPFLLKKFETMKTTRELSGVARGAMIQNILRLFHETKISKFGQWRNERVQRILIT